MSTIVESIEVNVPVRIAYIQWTRFDEFPKFMEGVKQVTQLDAKRLHWKAEIGGEDKEWVAKIIEQTPDKRIAWISRDAVLNGVMLTFHPLSDAKSKVLLRVGHTTEGFVKNVGDWMGEVLLRVQGDLERFKAFIEKRGRETGGWRPDLMKSQANISRQHAVVPHLKYEQVV